MHKAEHLSSRRPRGLALVTVLTLMGALLTLSLVGARLAILGERGARNERDAQIAFHAAEAALADADADLMGDGDQVFARTCAITGFDTTLFEPGCGATAVSRGLCAEGASTENLPLLEVNAGPRRYAQFGEFTGRVFNAGGAAGGVVPPPRYLVEAVAYTGGFAPAFRAFQVTAVGYGPQGRARAILQATVVKPAQVSECTP